MSSLRRRVELKAGPVVVLLGQAPRALVFGAVLVLLVGGLLAGGVLGAVLLLVLAVLAAVLLALSWPALQPGARVVRAAVLVLLLVRALAFLR